MIIQAWFLLGLNGLISLLSKGFSRVFSSTTVQMHIVYIICIVLSNPLLRSGASQAPPILCQHPAESKAISACQPFIPPHRLSPAGDSIAQTLLTYLKNSKLLQLKKNTCINMDQMHRSNLRGIDYGHGAVNRALTITFFHPPMWYPPAEHHQWVCSGFPLSKLALCLCGFSSALFLALWLTIEQKASFFNH